MCTNNFETTMEKSISTISSVRNSKIIKKINDFLNYAEKHYYCEFPDKFADKLYDIAYQKTVPCTDVVDALYTEWRIWKPYVTADSFNRFMIEEIESMFMINTTSTFESSILRGYIGNKAKVIKKIPEFMSTTVYMSGDITKNCMRVSIEKPE